VRLEAAEEAEEAEQDELEAMFKPKKKGRLERPHGEKKATVENFLVRPRALGCGLLGGTQCCCLPNACAAAGE
jgi:hypothetical protein